MGNGRVGYCSFGICLSVKMSSWDIVNLGNCRIEIDEWKIAAGKQSKWETVG